MDKQWRGALTQRCRESDQKPSESSDYAASQLQPPSLNRQRAETFDEFRHFVSILTLTAWL